MITIIDCDLGNIGSIRNMLRKAGADCRVSSSEQDILSADKLILPGVGKFDHGMSRINGSGLLPALNHVVLEDKKPLLGICLGMQLLTRGSEEGELPGLGWIAASTIRFPHTQETGNLKVPHMGWNRVVPSGEARLFDGLDPAETKFYFVHSYYVQCDSPASVAATTTYGNDFHSAVQSGNIFGVQFHPEKSHRYGLQLLRNFVKV